MEFPNCVHQSFLSDCLLFDEMREYRFETMTVKGFKDYDTYLKCIYGDYMTLPPEEKRVNHGIKPWRVNNYEK